jgi:hypothetical protein
MSNPTKLTRKQQNALAFLVMSKVADLAEYPEMLHGEYDLRGVDMEVVAQQLSSWMKKLPGTTWDDRLPQ